MFSMMTNAEERREIVDRNPLPLPVCPECECKHPMHSKECSVASVDLANRVAKEGFWALFDAPVIDFSDGSFGPAVAKASEILKFQDKIGLSGMLLAFSARISEMMDDPGNGLATRFRTVSNLL